jgi:hypothetical protein
MKFENVFKSLVSVVNFIRFHGHNHRHLHSFLAEIGAEYRYVLYLTEVRWLSRGTVLKCILGLRLQIEIFMDEKGKVVAEFDDEQWHWVRVVEFYCSLHLNGSSLTESHL